MRAFFIPLFIAIVFAGPSARAFQAAKRNGRIILQDPTCEALRADATSLAAWARNAQEENACQEKSLAFRETGGGCEVDATECLPSHVVKFQDAKPAIDGPNCWNLALVLKGILPSMRYAAPDEMSFYMGSPLCRALRDAEPRLPGDVGSIRSITEKGEGEAHAFIYISEKIAYSKNGDTRTAPYALQPLEQVYQTYGVPAIPACRTNRENFLQDCGSAVAFYRCSSMEDYLKQNSASNPELVSALRFGEAAETCLEARMLEGSPLQPGLTKAIENSTQILLTYLEKERRAAGKKPSAGDSFLLGSLQLRLSALQWQLHLGGNQPESDSMRDLSGMVGVAAARWKHGH